MAKRRKKATKKYHRKNPKRVAAGRKAARARWGHKASKKASKKTRRHHHVGIDRVEKAVEKVLSKHYTIALDGSRHKISFPGHGHTKKAGKHHKSRKAASPAQLAARARFTMMVKARAAARRGVPVSDVMYGPVYRPAKAGGGHAALVHAKRLASLAKARAVKAARSISKVPSGFKFPGFH